MADYNQERGHIGGGSFAGRAKNGFNVVLHSIKALFAHPILLLPIFVCWLFYAVIAVYFQYYFNWDILGPSQFFWTLFGIILSFCVLFSLSSLILLELIQQIETGKNKNFFAAVYEVFSKDFVKAFPIILVWAVIWFVLTILESMTRSKNDGSSSKRNEASYENVAKTLSGYQSFSLWNLSFDLINSGVRLVAFMIFPAIAWEDETSMNAVKKGFAVIKANIAEFVTGFALTEIAAAIIFLPPGIVYYFSDELKVNFPPYVWVITILYIAMGWTLYLYLQQMFAALLYMWNKRWLKQVKKAQAENLPIPSLRDVRPPNLLDNIPDLLI